MENNPLSHVPRVSFTYPDWKYKALTFSYDDGVVEDRQLVALFNKYGLKGTFNLVGSTLGKTERQIRPEEVAELYKGHEVASHTLSHRHLRDLTPEDIEKEISENQKILESLTGYPIRGFAYPYGEESAEMNACLERHGIVYARGTHSNRMFAEPTELAWQPSAHHDHDIMELGKSFINARGWGGVLMTCYIWGHSYEFARNNNWDMMEEFCKLMAGRQDIWYATNIQIHDYFEACRNVRMSLDGVSIQNKSDLTLYLIVDNQRVILPPDCQVPVAPVEGITYPDGTYMVFPGGRKKALTFSYDDGDPAADPRLLQIFKEHKLKGTFNLNGSRDGVNFSLYSNQEIACHGYNHLTYRSVPREKIAYDLFFDRIALDTRTGLPTVGFAWPNGATWSDCPASQTALSALGMAYARTTGHTQEAFEIPADFMRWDPTCHHREDILKKGEEFLATDKVPALFYVWGHSFEFNRANNWELMEDFAKQMGGKDDIWYATNLEIRDYVTAARSLNWSEDKSFVQNRSNIPVYYVVNGKLKVIEAGKITIVK